MDLLQNPFYLLTATPRDDRRRIAQLADDRSFLLEPSVCMSARSDLTNPKKRLSAEVAWLPGIGPKRIGEVLSLLQSSPMDLLDIDKISPIARANMLASGLAHLPDHNPNNVVQWILEIAWAFEGITSAEVSLVINEERIVSGFPEIMDISAVDAAIQERRRYYLKVIKLVLDTLPSKELVEVVTTTVESATDDGEEHGPILIADLIDSYEVEAQEFLEKEEKNIKSLIDRLEEAIDAELPDSVVLPIMNQLILVIHNWDMIAQPIQLGAKSRGLDHDASYRVAGLVRRLAIHIFNEHGKIDFSKQLTSTLGKVFAEVVEVAERTVEDIDALKDIENQRQIASIVNSISSQCTSALKKSGDNPDLAIKEAQELLCDASRITAKIEEMRPSANILERVKDEIALTLMNCAIIFGTKTMNWNPCIAIMEAASTHAASPEVQSRISTNLKTVHKNAILYEGLTPISEAPDLSTIIGFGTILYGSTDRDLESGSYLSTYYLVFLSIPIFPICRYRVIRTMRGYRFLGKAPLRTFDKWHIALAFALFVWALVSIWNAYPFN